LKQFHWSFPLPNAHHTTDLLIWPRFSGDTDLHQSGLPNIDYVMGLISRTPSLEVLSAIMQDVSFRELREFVGLKAVKCDTENARLSEKIREVNSAFFKKVAVTNYKDLCYFISGVDFSTNFTDTCREGKTYWEFYKDEKNISIQDQSQPFLINDMKMIAETETGISQNDEKISSTERPGPILLVPELCHIIGLTYEMYSVGLFLPDIFKHINEMIEFINTLENWQSQWRFPISKRLLKQVERFLFLFILFITDEILL
jgi:hypothetical protein